MAADWFGSALKVKSWRRVPPGDIVRDHPRVFSDPSAQGEFLIKDLPAYPWRDGQNRHNAIWDEQGNELEREVAEFDDDVKKTECGLLVDLTTVTSRFLWPADSPYAEFFETPPSSTPPTVTLRPLGFLGSVGNVEVSGISTNAHNVFAEVNDAILRAADRTGSLTDRRYIPPNTTLPLTGTSTLLYTPWAHHLPGDDRVDGVASGAISAEVGGSYRVSQGDDQKARAAEEYNSRSTPYHRAAAKLLEEDVRRSLYVEVVSSLDMDAARLGGRCVRPFPSISPSTGHSAIYAYSPYRRDVWKRVVAPLAEMYLRRDLSDEIKPCLRAYSPPVGLLQRLLRTLHPRS